MNNYNFSSMNENKACGSGKKSVKPTNIIASSETRRTDVKIEPTLKVSNN